MGFRSEPKAERNPISTRLKKSGTWSVQPQLRQKSIHMMNEVIQYYDQIASIYDNDRFDNSYGRFIDKQERKILHQLLHNEQGVIVDLACGSGRLLNYAQIGIDASGNMLQIAKDKYPDKQLIQSDANHIPLENDSVDVIICFHFFMHLNEKTIRSVLAECARILKPSGRLIFDIPSEKRRRLLRFKKTGWHGSSDTTIQKINTLTAFQLKSSKGVLFMPIHRFPNKIRHFMMPIDRLLCNSWIKEYSSYIVFELVKK
jgi:ubiquinone/menaquinone biosynthesis C-methylase UbiE